MNDELILQFSTSLEPASKYIRMLTHSAFSHVDGILEDGSCLGASDPGGVMVRPPDYQPFGIRRRAKIKTPLAEPIMEIVLQQVGKPFDNTAFSCFLDDPLETPAVRQWRLPEAWFCSELWCWALESMGLFRIIVPKNRVTPADLLLLLNPWLDDTFWGIPNEVNLGVSEQ